MLTWPDNCECVDTQEGGIQQGEEEGQRVTIAETAGKTDGFVGLNNPCDELLCSKREPSEDARLGSLVPYLPFGCQTIGFVQKQFMHRQTLAKPAPPACQDPKWEIIRIT